jgi:hypothetical protein
MMPLEKTPLWVKNGELYHVRSHCFGEFVGRCTDPHPEWASFEVMDGNMLLAAAGYPVGQVIDLPRQHTRVEEVP